MNGAVCLCLETSSGTILPVSEDPSCWVMARSAKLTGVGSPLPPEEFPVMGSLLRKEILFISKPGFECDLQNPSTL